MQVRYYKIGPMAYATRQRYLDISKFEYYKEEDNRSVRLGNGANTFVKTIVEDINEPKDITYVTIDGTRWFVTDYVYLNGKQVQLNLQRDVLGEFGLSNAYGKIERGYAGEDRGTAVLKYRKELSLNEVLKQRIPLTLSEKDNTYGNIIISSPYVKEDKSPENPHNGEMWGILYFVKDTKEATKQIPIPGFAPDYVTEISINTNTKYLKSRSINVYQKFGVNLQDSNGAILANFLTTITYIYKFDTNTWTGNFDYRELSASEVVSVNTPCVRIKTNKTKDYMQPNAGFVTWDGLIFDLCLRIYQDTMKGSANFNFPSIVKYPELVGDYNGTILYENSKYYSYSSRTNNDSTYGTNTTIDGFKSFISNLGTFSTHYENITLTASYLTTGIETPPEIKSECIVYTTIYDRTELDPSKNGTITVNMRVNLVDEPFVVLAFPLFDVNIKSIKDNESFSISKQNAFSVFNDVINGLSGENGFIVDAQIYPYCPNLGSVQTRLVVDGETDPRKGTYPFFSVQSTFFERTVTVKPLPSKDIKKDYITRSYSIVSPDQSGKFKFNLYDYVDKIVDGPGTDKNTVDVPIKIRTALKPFSIISAAVLPRIGTEERPCLIGIDYESNIDGSQSASGGYECSLSSNAFETYRRQNSNYQQLFDIDRNELIKSQEVERVNEATQFGMNMLTGTAFGAIAGAQLGDAGIWGAISGSKAIGAGVGAGVAAASIGVAGGLQLKKNDELRDYELQIQQQRYDLTIGTIKNLPNSVNRISAFNEIVMQNFYYVLEIYECTNDEMKIVDNFIANYGYGIGVFDVVSNYYKSGWFLKACITKSELPTNLHQILKTDIEGGVYIND